MATKLTGTQAEMIEKFGEGLAHEAVMLLLDANFGKTVSEIRAELRALAARRASPPTPVPIEGLMERLNRKAKEQGAAMWFTGLFMEAASELSRLAGELREANERIHYAEGTASANIDRATALAAEVERLKGGFDFRSHLQRQRDWSGKTFGPGPRTKGVIDHIRKELGEIEADPSDIAEWIDVVILALDGAWRAGHSPDQITAALTAKQSKNERRNWPDWRTMPEDQAIEHVRTGKTRLAALGREGEATAALTEPVKEG